MCELLDAVEDPVLATLEGAQQRLDIIFGAIVVRIAASSDEWEGR